MIQIGIIGTNEAASEHTTALAAHQAFEIVGCYDANSRESMLFARKYRLVSYSSLEALFKYCDAIDIATEIPDLYAVAEKSLKALKHLSIACPHSLNDNELRQLLKLADESGVALQLNTKYNDCPVQDYLCSFSKTPESIRIDFKRSCLLDANIALTAELPYCLSFALGILNANIQKIDINPQWFDSEAIELQCQLLFDNKSRLNLTLCVSPDEQLEMKVGCVYPDMTVEADVFRSEVTVNYIDLDVVDRRELEPYNERLGFKRRMTQFSQMIAASLSSQLVRNSQWQCFSAASLIIDKARQAQVQNRRVVTTL